MSFAYEYAMKLAMEGVVHHKEEEFRNFMMENAEPLYKAHNIGFKHLVPFMYKIYKLGSK